MQVETKTACIDRLIAALERLRLAEGRVLCPSDIDSEAPVDVSAHIQRHCVAFAVGLYGCSWLVVDLSTHASAHRSSRADSCTVPFESCTIERAARVSIRAITGWPAHEAQCMHSVRSVHAPTSSAAYAGGQVSTLPVGPKLAGFLRVRAVQYQHPTIICVCSGRCILSDGGS